MKSALALLLAAIAPAGCRDAPPDATERARMTRAMDKMEAEQAQSDIARAAVKARADADDVRNKAIGAAQEERAQTN